MPNTSTPTHRTRSGSNAQNITLQEIKTLLDNLKSELKQEINKVNDKIETLFEKVNETVVRVSKLEKKCHSLEIKLAKKDTSCSLDTEALMHEAEERHRRRKYLVISGIPEHTTGNVEERRQKDLRKVKVVVSKAGVKSFEPEQLSRIGSISSSRPRLLRFKCESMETRNSILKGAKLLKSSQEFRNTYINADQTLQQRKKNKELREELRRRKEAGEDVAIRRGQIVDLAEEQNFL